MTKARDIADFKFENITDTGTEGTRIAKGTTAQRGTTQGQIRFNTDLGLAEYYDGTAFKIVDTPPSIVSVDKTNIESSTLPTNLVITGTSFNSASVKFIGADGTEYSSPSVTTNSSTQITAQVPATVTSDNEPFDVKVINASSLANTLEDAFNIDASPEFSVASGSLGTLEDIDRAASNLTAVTATDDEGDSITFSVTSGTIPTGLTLNSDGTWSGTANAETSTTTYTFTVTASDGTNTSTRQYTITVEQPIATGGTTQTYNIGGTDYVSHTFLSSGTFTLNSNKTVDVLLVGGGGAGAAHTTVSSTGGGGGGAGGFRTIQMSLTAGSFAATVGGGGSAGTSADPGGVLSSNGGNTTFNSYSAQGGGRGDARTGQNGSRVGDGGSGGGAGYDYPTIVGSGNTPSTSPSQGNNGGQGFGVSPNSPSEYPSLTGFAGGGGGGASATGGNWRNDGTNVGGGNGGAGSQNNYRTGSNQYYAAGGGGGSGGGNGTFNNVGGTGGSSIGGNGAGDTTAPTSPTQNTGSGGGGCGGATNLYNPTAGADGIIVIRYAV